LDIVEYDAGKQGNLWKDFLADCSDVSPYHTREWGEVLRRTFEFKERSLVALKDGSISGVLPLWQVNKKTIVNSPWRDRADLLFKDDCRELFLQCLSGLPFDVVVKGWGHSKPSAGFRLENYWVTSVLDLSCGIDLLWERVNKTVGRNIRKAERTGVVISREISGENMSCFYELFKMTRKRLGIPIYPRKLFQNILSCLSNKILRLYVAFIQKKPISAAIFLDGDLRAIYAYGASNIQYQAYRANDLIMWTAIGDSVERGKVFFDFGADSPTQQGLLHFKSKWGATQYNLTTLRKSDKHTRPEKLDFSSERYRFQRYILSHMPVSFLILLGEHMTRRNG